MALYKSVYYYYYYNDRSWSLPFEGNSDSWPQPLTPGTPTPYLCIPRSKLSRVGIGIDFGILERYGRLGLNLYYIPQAYFGDLRKTMTQVQATAEFTTLLFTTDAL